MKSIKASQLAKHRSAHLLRDHRDPVPEGDRRRTGILQISASGVIWVAALLASLLSLDHLFRSDFEDGALEQPLMSPHPLSVSGYHPTTWAIAAALRISLD